MVAGAFDSEGGLWDNSEGIDILSRKMGKINEHTRCIHLQAVFLQNYTSAWKIFANQWLQRGSKMLASHPLPCSVASITTHVWCLWDPRRPSGDPKHRLHAAGTRGFLIIEPRKNISMLMTCSMYNYIQYYSLMIIMVMSHSDHHDLVVINNHHESAVDIHIIFVYCTDTYYLIIPLNFCLGRSAINHRSPSVSIPGSHEGSKRQCLRKSGFLPKLYPLVN